jgi:hypothetical protein
MRLASGWDLSSVARAFWGSARMCKRRGLFRMWILLCVGWSVGYFEYFLTHAYFTQYGVFFNWPRFLHSTLTPWLATAAVFGLRWAINGFRSNKAPGEYASRGNIT